MLYIVIPVLYIYKIIAVLLYLGNELLNAYNMSDSIIESLYGTNSLCGKV